MKNTLTLSIAAVAALATSAFGADYSVFRVCEDQRVIRTSDGAEAGHVEYIVVDPSDQKVISSIVTGGVIGDKFVAVPFSSMRFDADRSITLTEINRERIISAPIIERNLLSAATVIRSDAIDRTSEHFGVRANAAVNSTSVNTNVRQENRADRATRDSNVAGRAARMRNDSDRGADAARDESSKRIPERSRDASSAASERSRNGENAEAASRRNHANQNSEAQDQADTNKRDSTDRSSQMNRGDRENKRPSSASELRASGTSTGNRERPNARNEQSGAKRPAQESANPTSQNPSSERRSQTDKEEMPAKSRNSSEASPRNSSLQSDSSPQSSAATPGANSASTPERNNTSGSR